MVIACDELLDELSDSGILSHEELFDVKLEQYSSRERRAADASSVCQNLVRNGRLTAFQANMAMRGQSRALRLGEYIVLDRLGDDQSVVLLGRHQSMPRRVVISALPQAIASDAPLVERFFAAVSIAGRLLHPNLAMVYDAGRATGHVYLVTEYISGQSLRQLLAACGRLQPVEAVRYTIQAAMGLDAAHQRGIIHGDVRPARLMLDQERTVKVLETGLSRYTTAANRPLSERSSIVPEQVLDIAMYLAPEQESQSQHLDGRCDIYSLGCTLYHLLTGQPPFGGTTVQQICVAHAHRSSLQLDLQRLAPDLPHGVAQICQRMIARDPEQRFADMAEVVAALLNVMPQAAPYGLTPQQMPRRYRPRAVLEVHEPPPTVTKRSGSVATALGLVVAAGTLGFIVANIAFHLGDAPLREAALAPSVLIEPRAELSQPPMETAAPLTSTLHVRLSAGQSPVADTVLMLLPADKPIAPDAAWFGAHNIFQEPDIVAQVRRAGGWRAITDREGSAAFEALPPGDYWLLVVRQVDDANQAQMAAQPREIREVFADAPAVGELLERLDTHLQVHPVRLTAEAQLSLDIATSRW